MATASKEEIIAYHEGIKEGLWRHAYWKDGVQYVGNMGTTLEEAYQKVGQECANALAGSIE